MRSFLIIGLAMSPYILAQHDRDIRVHGFVSQGFVNSHGHDYLVEDSQDGSFEFTEMALNIFAKPIPKLSVGLQVFARDLGEEGNNEPIIDWAVADYRWRDSLGLRLGKIKAPIGFYNKGRDADLLRPSVFLPQGVYSEDFRDITLAYQGFGLYGNLGDGALDYEVYLGATNLPEDIRLIQNLFREFNVPLHHPDLDIERLYGFALRWNTPLDGLSLGTSIVRAKGNLEDGELPIRLEFNDVEINTFSLEYMRGDFVFSAEYSEIEFPVENVSPIPLPPFPRFGPMGYYCQVSWQAREKLQLSYQYDVSYDSKDDKDGLAFVERGLPDFLGWQKDHMLAIRYDVNTHFILKLEGRAISGADRAIIDFTDPDREENWSFYAAKASFHF